MDNRTLQHWGIKGMKWGVRRYQDKAGNLTDLGKKRYARDASEKGYNQGDAESGYYKISGKKNRREDLDFDADRYVRENRERTRDLLNESANMSGKLKNVVDKSIRNNKIEKMDLSNMTDKEMREQINRELLERQYNDMFAPRKSTRGREYVSRTLEVAGDVAAIGASALTIAVAIQKLRGKTILD